MSGAAIAATVAAICVLLALIACRVAANAGVLVIHFRKPPKPRQRAATPAPEAKP